MSGPDPQVISRHVARLRAGDDGDRVLTMPSGHAVLNGRQPAAIRGCCVLLPDPVPAALNDLPARARALFLRDLGLLGDAVLEVTGAERVNYLILCNQAPELHAHCIPRYAAEDPARRRLGPFAAYDFGQSPALDAAGADRGLLLALREALARRLAGAG